MLRFWSDWRNLPSTECLFNTIWVQGAVHTATLLHLSAATTMSIETTDEGKSPSSQEVNIPIESHILPHHEDLSEFMESIACGKKESDLIETSLSRSSSDSWSSSFSTSSSSSDSWSSSFSTSSLTGDLEGHDSSDDERHRHHHHHHHHHQHHPRKTKDRLLAYRLGTHHRTRAIIQIFIFASIATFTTVYRLTFDCVNAVYLVHSLVIFLDLMIGNIASRNLLFNLAINILALTCAMVYKCFSVIVIELFETTAMAVIASIYGLCVKFKHRRAIEDHLSSGKHYYKLHKILQKRFGKTMFEFIIEEFIDGSSGIMYTSFAGLVFIEFAGLYWDNKSYLYCLWPSTIWFCNG